jgi:hypothetical protein
MDIVTRHFALNHALQRTRLGHCGFNPRVTCAGSQAYYQAHRERGHSHACALRCLGQRWLKILWRMWQDRRPYDENLHALNQQRHGSWVLQLKPKEA